MRLERAQRLKAELEAIHRQFVISREVENDAIAPALAFKDPLDQELVALICAVLAYGKIRHIQASVRKLITPLGPRPSLWLKQASAQELGRVTRGWQHRFNDEQDALFLLRILKAIYVSAGSMELFVSPRPGQNSFDVIEDWIRKLQELESGGEKCAPPPESSFWFFFPRPSSGSACKRLCLYLRWMVGRSEMDLGLWSSMHTRDLIVPIDTHLLRQSRSLRLTRRTGADRKTALEVTQKLRLLDPEDPTRFDFALCHLGIRGGAISTFS